MSALQSFRHHVGYRFQPGKICLKNRKRISDKWTAFTLYILLFFNIQLCTCLTLSAHKSKKSGTTSLFISTYVDWSMKEKWDIIQRKKGAEMLSAVGSSSVIPLSKWWSVCWHLFDTSLPQRNSLAIHAETHSHDWVLLSEEPSQDVHWLLTSSARSCISLWHFDRPF